MSNHNVEYVKLVEQQNEQLHNKLQASIIENEELTETLEKERVSSTKYKEAVCAFLTRGKIDLDRYSRNGPRMTSTKPDRLCLDGSTLMKLRLSWWESDGRNIGNEELNKFLHELYMRHVEFLVSHMKFAIKTTHSSGKESWTWIGGYDGK